MDIEKDYLRKTMRIHEYQAKQILKNYEIPIPKGSLALSVDKAFLSARNLKKSPWVVKAQIHAGGRGKAGGIIICHSLEEVENASRKLLGKRLITPQTGPQGQIVHRLYIEEGCPIVKQFYLSFFLERRLGCIAVMASTEGGVDIERAMQRSPEKFLIHYLDPAVGISEFHGRTIGELFSLRTEAITGLGHILRGIYQAFQEKDASLIEINPLVTTADDEFIALDAKMSFDSNSLYRHPEIADLRDPDEEDPLEREANDFGLTYIKLKGSIGCIFNGAGLGMATLDMIKAQGGDAANFLDVGGMADEKLMTTAMSLVTKDAQVKAILVNFFASVVPADSIAEGIIIGAHKKTIPIVVCLQGENAARAHEILNASKSGIVVVKTIEEAAATVVKLARGSNVHPRR